MLKRINRIFEYLFVMMFVRWQINVRLNHVIHTCRGPWRAQLLMVLSSFHSRRPVDRTCGNTSSERKSKPYAFCVPGSLSTTAEQRPILFLTLNESIRRLLQSQNPARSREKVVKHNSQWDHLFKLNRVAVSLVLSTHNARSREYFLDGLGWIWDRLLLFVTKV